MKCSINLLPNRLHTTDQIRNSQPNSEYFGEVGSTAYTGPSLQQSQSVRSLHRTQLSTESSRSRKKPTSSPAKKFANMINMSNYLKNQMEVIRNRSKAGRDRIVAMDRRNHNRQEQICPDGTTPKRIETSAKERLQNIRNKLEKKASESHNPEPFGRRRLLGEQGFKKRNVEEYPYSQNRKQQIKERVFKEDLMEPVAKYEAQQQLLKYESIVLKSSKSTEEPQGPLSQASNHIHTIVECSTENYPSEKLQSTELVGASPKSSSKKLPEVIQSSNSPSRLRQKIQPTPSLSKTSSVKQLTKRDSQIARQKSHQQQPLPNQHTQPHQPTSELSRVVFQQRPQLHILSCRPNRVPSNSSSTDSLKLQSNIISRIRCLNSSSVVSKLNLLKTTKSSKSEIEQTLAKIELHLEIVNRIGEYVESSEELYERGVWDKENFMVYKKYYMERVRVEEGVLGGYGKNCFMLAEVGIDREVIVRWGSKEEVRNIYQQVRTENIGIKKCLERMLSKLNIPENHEVFNLNCQKSKSSKLNSEIYGAFGREVRSLKHILATDNDQQRLQATEQRLIDIVQLTFLIEELSDCFVKPFSECEEVQDFSQFLKDNQHYFWGVLRKYGRA